MTQTQVGPRFWERVNKTLTCWLWTGSLVRDGYGSLRANGRQIYAHRYSWELVNGPVPDGLTLDHLCRNRGCVKPAHLEPVTWRTNILRGFGPSAVNARKTHCIRGHLLDRVHVNSGSSAGKRRRCSSCKRVDNALYKARRRAA
jgi:hypothetical protein